jgi:hypothetical protein
MMRSVLIYCRVLSAALLVALAAFAIQRTALQAQLQPNPNVLVRLDARLAEARARSLDRFLNHSPVSRVGQVITARQPMRPHPATNRIIPDVTLLRSSDGGVLVQLHERSTMKSLMASPHPTTITYLNLRDAIYRVFVLQGEMPNAAEQQRIREQFVSDGFPLYEAPKQQARTAPPPPRPRRTPAPNLWAAVSERVGRLTRFIYPTLKAQAPGCYGYAYSSNGAIDPAGITLVELYPRLDWGVDYNSGWWYAYGNDYDYYNGNPTRAGTHWYVYSFDGYDEGEAWGGGYMDEQMTFYNTDFPGNPPPVPVYVSLYDYIGYDYGSIDFLGDYHAWGASSAGLLRNYPTGNFGNLYDNCF